MKSYKAIKQKISAIKKIVEKEAKNIIILLAVNTKKKTRVPDDYENFSVKSEYFSDAELEEIVSGFQAIGCAVDFSNGEQEFMEKLVNNKFEKFNHLKKIVYNSSGAGTGKSRSALLPALCNLYNFENCSNDIYTSVIAENKVHFFNLLEYYGFPVPQTWYYDHKKKWLTGEPEGKQLLIAKPAYESSSIGVSDKSVSGYSNKFKNYIRDLSYSLRQPVIVQQFIKGYEVEVPVFDIGDPFAPMSVGIKIGDNENSGHKFLTYEEVYSDEYSFFSFCKKMPQVGKELRKTACSSFEKLGLRGVVRVDFRVTDKGKFYIMDYNNNPHLTRFHSCALSIKYLGFDYSDMFALLLFRHIKGL